MEPRHLHILWTNADPVTGELMVMMYATNALKNKWWDEVTVILWGATTRLVAESAAMQALLAAAQDMGVQFVGCIACTEALGVTQQLRERGVALTKWGPPLTELIQSGRPLISV